MHIAVIGSGYVGLVTGACFAEFGVDVTCVDVDADKIAQLALGKSTIYEPGLEQLLKKNLQAGRLRFTTDSKSAIRQSLVIFLAVGTPSIGAQITGGTLTIATLAPAAATRYR